MSCGDPEAPDEYQRILDIQSRAGRMKRSNHPDKEKFLKLYSEALITAKTKYKEYLKEPLTTEELEELESGVALHKKHKAYSVYIKNLEGYLDFDYEKAYYETIKTHKLTTTFLHTRFELISEIDKGK
jgi:hypothetical protein